MRTVHRGMKKHLMKHPEWYQARLDECELNTIFWKHNNNKRMMLEDVWYFRMANRPFIRMTRHLS